MAITVERLAEILAARKNTIADQDIFDHGNDVQILGLTLYGEGRGESLHSRAAIAWTVRNRRLKYPTDKDKRYAQICLRRLQYSCWWEVGGAANFEQTLLAADSLYGDPKAVLSNWNQAILRECLWIAQGVIGGQIVDPTKGSTHYLTKALYDNAALRPSWAKHDKIVANIGSHLFLAGIA